MQEQFPPLNEHDIQALIAEYLDTATPTPQQTARLQQVLSQYPQATELFTQQQATKATMSQLAHHIQAPIDAESGSSLWGKLSGQLRADERAEVRPYDADFISAYYDGEIPSSDPELEVFEAQLYQNMDANRMLADIGDISELVRNFGYRLEESCTVDVTAAVMARYQAELGDNAEMPDDGETLDPHYETLSALYDQELSAKDTIELNARIEADDASRRVLGEFNELSDHILRVSEQIQAQAPDFVPLIAPQLPQIVVDNKAPAKLLLFKKRFAIPAIAAAVLLLIFNLNTGGPGAPQNASIISSQPAASEIAYEVAALPGAVVDQSADVHPVAYQSAPGLGGDGMPAPQRVASNVSQSYAKAHRDQAIEEIPSSEAYLFEALNQQVSSEDVLPLVLSDDTF